MNDYIKGGDSKIKDHKYGNLTLEQLRNQFQSDESKFQQLNKRAIREKETQLADEIEKLKRDKQVDRMNRNKVGIDY